MQFSELPQFIRNDIINLVIRDDLKYCHLNLEWLISVVNLYGKLYLGRQRVDQDVRAIPFSQYLGYVWFGRIIDIDWDRLYSYKSIKEVEFNIDEDHSKVEWSKFKDGLLSLPPLSKISIDYCPEVLILNITGFLISQLQLKELKIPLKLFNRYFNDNPDSLPNLTDLTLTFLDSSFDIRKILKYIPKLKRLSIDSYSQYEHKLSFSNCVIPNVKELNIRYFQIDIPIKLDLLNWPSLTKLNIDCATKFIDLNNLIHLRDLSLMGSAQHLSYVMTTSFTNLKYLSLDFRDIPDSDAIINIFQSCHTVTNLELKIYDELEFPENLPLGPYSITKLYLNGPFHISSSLLSWLSRQFQLITLRLKHCILTHHRLLIFPFPSLTLLFILTDDIMEYKRQFNSRAYPQIRRIVIGRACDSHDGKSEMYLDDEEEEEEGEEINRMFYGYGKII